MKEGTKNNNKNNKGDNKSTDSSSHAHQQTLARLTNPMLHDNLTKHTDIVSQLPSFLKFRPVDLHFAISQDCVLYFSDKEKRLLQALEQVQDAASDIRKAAHFFTEVDENYSGSIDKAELQVLLQKLGIEISENRLTSLIKRYDVNDSDSLDFVEFLALVKHQKLEAEHRIREFTDRPILVEGGDSDTPSTTAEAYLPPESGYLSITVTNDLTRTGFSRVLTTCDCDHILSVVKSLGGVNFLEVVLSCLDHSLLRMNEALTLIDLLLIESRDKVEIVRRVLMQLYDSNEAILFIHSVFHHNRQEVMRLKWEYGMALRPLLGNPNGYYLLDLSKEIDRKCLLKLVKISHREKYRRMTAAIHLLGGDESRHYHVGDLSQHGDYSCFRNELFNNEPMPLSDQFAAHLPSTGILQFDFSSTYRPTGDHLLHAKNDPYIVQLLVKHHLIHPSEYETAMRKLGDYRELGEKSLGGSGRTIYECPPMRAAAIAQHMHDFYENLKVRADQYSDARNKVCKPVAAPSQAPTHPHRRSSTTGPDNSTSHTVVGDFERDSYPMPSMLAHNYTQTITTTVSSRPTSGVSSSESQQTARPPSHSSSQPPQHYLVPSALTSKTSSASRDKEIDFSLDSNDSWDELCVSASRDDLDLTDQLKPHPHNTHNSHNHGSSSHHRHVNTHEQDAANKLGIAEQRTSLTPIREIPENSSFHLLKKDHSHIHSQHEEEFRSPLSSHAAHNTDRLGLDDSEYQEALQLELEILEKARKMKEQTATLKKQNQKLAQSQHQLLSQYREIQHPSGSSSSLKDDFLSKFKTLLESIHVQDATKAHRLVDLLEDIFCRTWIYARHLALMLECFVQFGYYKQTQYFGTYRVELVVSIFTRIIDIHNFELVLQVLSPFEAACVICRLGYLLIFNPCKPEGAWELDLTRREERLIVKMLCTLGIYEPGNNFLNPSFRWSRDVESVPGWELVQPWLTEEGLPTKGILQVTYYSGEGKGLHGCKPFVSFRKALLQFVLMKEEEMVEEEFAAIALKTASQSVTVREACFMKYQELWETYFVPLPSQPQQQMKKGKKKMVAKK